MQTKENTCARKACASCLRALKWLGAELLGAAAPLAAFEVLLTVAYVCAERSFDPLDDIAFGAARMFPAALLCAGAGRALGRAGRWVQLVAFVFVYVLVAVDSYAWFVFSICLGGELLSFLYSVSWAEIREFFGTQLGLSTWRGVFRTLPCVVPLVSGVWLILRRRGRRSADVRGFAFAALAALPFAAMTIAGEDTLGGLAFMRIPASCFNEYNLYSAVGEASARPKLPERIVPELGTNGPPIVVFAIGESATRNRMSLYGYGKPTTPAMDARRAELVVFSGIRAPTAYTATAMLYLCTCATLEAPCDMRWTLAAAARRAGYRTCLFSMHQPLGLTNSPELALFAECDDRRWPRIGVMKEGFGQGDFEFGRANVYDCEVVDDCLAELKAHPEGAECVFVHFYGSHFDATWRTPAGEKVFGADTRGMSGVDAAIAVYSAEYDNSIRYTDKQLERIVSYLESTGRPAALFYISDHGESPDSKTWRDVSDKSVWEIPAFAWFSNEYAAAFPDTIEAFRAAADAKMGADRLMPWFCEILRVRGLDGAGPAVPPNGQSLLMQ